MDDTGRGVLYRWPVEAPWLGRAAEALLTPDSLILRDAATGATATLDLSELVSVADGPTGVRFRVRRRGCWIDFGGVAFDGWYEVGCRDDDGRADFVAALAHALANVRGGQPLPTPFLSRLRRPRLPLA